MAAAGAGETVSRTWHRPCGSRRPGVGAADGVGQEDRKSHDPRVVAQVTPTRRPQIRREPRMLQRLTALDAALRLDSRRTFALRYGGQPSPDTREGWWRRRELNPRPKARRRGTLHACPLLGFRARRVEAAKYRQALAPENLAGTRRGTTCPPACLMAFGPQPPGEVEANVTA